eukprot:scaffold1236_cov503-Prasinococcus_capsulatus_cf.AAC.1
MPAQRDAAHVEWPPVIESARTGVQRTARSRNMEFLGRHTVPLRLVRNEQALASGKGARHGLRPQRVRAWRKKLWEATGPVCHRAQDGVAQGPCHAKRRDRGAGRTGVAYAARDSGSECSSSSERVHVKVCGVTSAEDATLACAEGADFIGMIMWAGSKRGISTETAGEVVAAAKSGGAQPIGVFVSESADEILSKCAASGLDIAQLHGDGARAALDGLKGKIRLVYVIQVDAEGHAQTPLPSASDAEYIDYLLVDGLVGGSGDAYDWNNLQVL